MIKRLTSVFFVCALLSFILVVPASAAVLDGTANWSGGYSSTAASGSFNLSNSVSGSVAYSSTNKNTQTLFESTKRSEDGYYALSQLNVPLTNVSSSVTVACSYYLEGGNRDSHVVLGYLPAPVMPFAFCVIAISVVFLVLGR